MTAANEIREAANDNPEAKVVEVPAAITVPSPALVPNMPSPRSLIKKLAQVMGELGWVEKRGWNKFHDYFYALESDILDELRKRLGDRNIFVQTVIERVEETDTGKTQGTNKDKVMRSKVYTLHHFHDGDSGEVLTMNGVGFAEDTTDKGLYKAMTGAMKYVMLKNFLISSGDDPERSDGDAGKGAKGKKAEGAGQPPSQPQRQPGRDEAFDITAPVDEIEVKTVGAGSKKYGFKIAGAPAPGWASTFDEKIYEKLKREKDSGMLIIFTLKRSAKGNFLDIVSARLQAEPA